MKEIYTLEALQRPRDYVDTEFLRMRETIEKNMDLAYKRRQVHIWEKR